VFKFSEIGISTRLEVFGQCTWLCLREDVDLQWVKADRICSVIFCQSVRCFSLSPLQYIILINLFLPYQGFPYTSYDINFLCDCVEHVKIGNVTSENWYGTSNVVFFMRWCFQYAEKVMCVLQFCKRKNVVIQWMHNRKFTQSP
jgi:hypothetical protein